MIPGWNERVRSLRDNAIFWNNLWKDAGCPALGSVADIRKKTKSKFKYAVRRLKRRRKFIIREKLSHLLGTLSVLVAIMAHTSVECWDMQMI